VLLADRNGITVERRGAPGDDATFISWGLWPGTGWSEESEGTNSIGTCLAEQRAITIHRDQHFLTRNTLLSCTTAPVYDHKGHVAAAFDVSSCRADQTEALVNLIAMAVVPGRGGRFSLDNGRELRFLTRSRVCVASIADGLETPRRPSDH
jgi:transcriptional regulator of acetoin/glycerol metabolism